MINDTDDLGSGHSTDHIKTMTTRERHVHVCGDDDDDWRVSYARCVGHRRPKAAYRHSESSFGHASRSRRNRCMPEGRLRVKLQSAVRYLHPDHLHFTLQNTFKRYYSRNLYWLLRTILALWCQQWHWLNECSVYYCWRRSRRSMVPLVTPLSQQR